MSNTSRLASIWLMLVSISLLPGCSGNLNRTDVIGTYEARHAAGSERIELRSDNTYGYRFKPVVGSELNSTDKWEFTDYGDGKKVALYNFYSHFPPRFPGAEIMLLGVHKEWGQIRLYVSYDLNLYYSKISSR